MLLEREIVETKRREEEKSNNMTNNDKQNNTVYERDNDLVYVAGFDKRFSPQ